jgi:putative aldouronate transport system permease protein
LLAGISVLCLLPLAHILAISLSDKASVAAGYVNFWPRNLTMASYSYVMAKKEFWQSIAVSVKRIILGGGLSVAVTVLTAYPLSKPYRQFRRRTAYVWFFVVTMLFNGGIIPTYMLVRQLGLIDSIWALVLPPAVQVFNIVLLLNFYREIPAALEEAALIDGAGHWKIWRRIYVPLSVPAIATVTLFTLVGHWNEWFGGLIYMNRLENYPLQTYLQSVVVQTSLAQMSTGSIAEMTNRLLVSDRTFKAAQIFIGALPVLCFYPFLQKYFVKGITLGGVKG